VPGRLLRRVLLPARGFLRPAFSSLAPFEVGPRRVLFGLRALPGRRTGEAGLTGLRDAAAGDLAYELWLARSTGPVEPIGTLRVGEQVTGSRADGLHFNPWRTGPGIRPVGWLNRLRRPSYGASQEGRPD
jgi:hypothetical protein